MNESLQDNDTVHVYAYKSILTPTRFIYIHTYISGVKIKVGGWLISAYEFTFVIIF